jgi:hypothetical protein
MLVTMYTTNGAPELGSEFEAMGCESTDECGECVRGVDARSVAIAISVGVSGMVVDFNVDFATEERTGLV